MADEAEPDTGGEISPDGPDSPAESPPTGRGPALRRMSPLQAAIAGGAAVVLVLAALCGWLGYRTYQQVQTDNLHARLISAARQAAINLTTVDYQHAEHDVQRILDSSTGGFYDDFKTRSGPFIDVVKKVQSASAGTVSEAALESASGAEGQVLVAVTVTTTSAGVTDPQPRYWRMRMTVTETAESKDAKVSRVDFIP